MHTTTTTTTNNNNNNNNKTSYLIYHVLAQPLVDADSELFAAYRLRFLLELLPQAHHEPRALIVGEDVIRVASFIVEALIVGVVHLLTTVFVSLDPYSHRHVFKSK